MADVNVTWNQMYVYGSIHNMWMWSSLRTAKHRLGNWTRPAN